MPPDASRIVVAINPNAAFGAHRDVGARAVQALRSAGHEVTALAEPDLSSLLRVAQAAVHTGPDALIVVGGDGMVQLGVGLVAETGIPLGIVPAGTGNDNARGLGIPIGDTDAAIRGILDKLEHPPRVIDAARATALDGSTRWFLGILSAGFDAAVNERANLMRRPRGRSRYTLALLRELAGLAPRRYGLELEGIRSEQDAVLVAIANNTSVGGGMRFAPDASLTDGLFDVVTLDPVSRGQLLRIFPSVFSGRHIDDPRVTVRRAARVRVDAPDVIAYADGERIGPLPLELEVVPGALAVLA